MSDPEHFLSRWSRRKSEQKSEVKAEEKPVNADAPAAKPPPATNAAPPDQVGAAEPVFDPASLPSIELDRSANRHSRLPAAGRASGCTPRRASARLVGGPGDPRLQGAAGERLEFQRPERDPRVRSAEPRYRRQENGVGAVRRKSGTRRKGRRGRSSPASSRDAGRIHRELRERRDGGTGRQWLTRRAKQSCPARRKYCAAR